MPVGESTHADPDSLEHAVAGELVHDQGRLHLVRRMVVMLVVMIMMITMVIMMMVHDQGRLHLAGLLVGVGHKATHKVGLTVVP